MAWNIQGTERRQECKNIMVKRQEKRPSQWTRWGQTT